MFSLHRSGTRQNSAKSFWRFMAVAFFFMVFTQWLAVLLHAGNEGSDTVCRSQPRSIYLLLHAPATFVTCCASGVFCGIKYDLLGGLYLKRRKARLFTT